MAGLVVTGVLAGLGLGYMLSRAGLCFHATWRGLIEGRRHLFRVWILAVSGASVGLSVIYATDWWSLNEGLALRPLGNVLGGLTIGVGMAVASTCVSGLFYKLGEGMLGATVGLAAWFAGDVLASRSLVGREGSLDLRGSVVALDGDRTIPEVIGIDRAVVSVVFLVVVYLLLRRSSADPAAGSPWSWRRAGVGLGAATTAGWALAGIGGASFGPSSVGAPASLVDGGGADTWVVAFLLALIGGSFAAAILSRSLRVRGESGVRYIQLAGGGLLLGIGGQIAGGCNLGHGLSGAAQLNVSSWVTVAAIIGGIAAARSVGLLTTGRAPSRP